ncbi:MAG: DUF6599 family protein [bacterium]
MKTFILGLCLLSSGSAQTVSDKQLFPAIPGWKLKIEPQVYVPDNLWDAIDGAADLFLEYGFVNLHIARYEKSDSYEIKVELYRHNSLVNAFGMYSQERAPEYRFIQLGAQGYFATAVLNFMAGEYYVKLTSSKSDKAAEKDLLLIGNKIAGALKQPIQMPRSLALLPKASRHVNSEQFVAKSFLGYSFFNGVFTANYGTANPYKLFLIETENPVKAEELLATYRKTLPINAMTKQDGNSYLAADPHNGTIGLMLQNKFLCGIINSEDASVRQKAMKDFMESLKNVK